MATERQYGEVIFICDECSDAYESGTDDFNDARSDLKKSGWLTMKDEDADEGWTHICPACQKLMPKVK